MIPLSSEKKEPPNDPKKPPFKPPPEKTPPIEEPPEKKPPLRDPQPRRKIKAASRQVLAALT
ncbi:MAG: hypothetical protein ABW172_12475 [Candidatus Binatia bacterium]